MRSTTERNQSRDLLFSQRYVHIFPIQLPKHHWLFSPLHLQEIAPILQILHHYEERSILYACTLGFRSCDPVAGYSLLNRDTLFPLQTEM
jgi:hypothetical protein